MVGLLGRELTSLICMLGVLFFFRRLLKDNKIDEDVIHDYEFVLVK